MNKKKSNKETNNTDRKKEKIPTKTFFKKVYSKTQKNIRKYKTHKMYKTFKKFFKNYGIPILTLFIVCFMYIQIKISEDNTRRQLRAYLIPEKPTLLVPPESLFVFINERLPVLYTIKNNGQTPAYDVRDSVNVRILERHRKPKEIVNKVRDTYHPLYGANTKHTRIIHSGWKNPVIKEYFIGTHKTIFETTVFSIYVWGRIEYTDIFKDCHWTEFCYEFVFDPPIREFRTYSTCNQADRKDPYKPPFF